MTIRSATDTRRAVVTYDPLSKVDDEPLHINAGIFQALVSFRSQTKLLNLPGTDTVLERERLSKVANCVADALIRDVEANPSKRWVMRQFQIFLVTLGAEDTEGREHLGAELERLMDILGIASSDGLLAFYLGGI